MVISIDSSILAAYYQVKNGATAGSGPSATTSKTPIPPWQSTSTAPQASALVTSVLGGSKFFDPTKTQLTATPATDPTDYKSLFTLYQGLNALSGLAAQAGAANVSGAALARYSTAFASGLGQLTGYLATKPFTTLDVAQGAIGAKAQTTQGVNQETDTYTGAAVGSGSPTDAVAAWSGPTAFSITVKPTVGASQTIAFDLSNLGAQTRSVANVVNYLNGKLKTAGVATRFADARTPGAAETVTSGGKTTTVGTAADTFSLQVKGTALEAVSFSAPDAAPAVYLASTSGTTTGTAPDAVRQLIKLNADPGGAAGRPSDGYVSTTALSTALTSARATATSPDGAVYVLGDVDAKTSGQTIKGSSDVALFKYDSAGQLLFTQTLGASSAASGYALTVSADGSKVAIAGSTTGSLDANDIADSPTSTDSFVTVYNAKGEEQWTSTTASAADDQASAVAFGADGKVYVAGTAQGALAGQTSAGGQDGYLRGFSATGGSLFTTQFGGAGFDSPAGLAVSGNTVVVAGTESGRAVVRGYGLQATGAPALQAVRDLGDLGGGNVAGVAVAADGSIVVAGSTHNGDLQVGSNTNAGNIPRLDTRTPFVATLSSDLVQNAGEQLNYVLVPGQSAGGLQPITDETVTGFTLSGGQAYLTGQIGGTSGAKQGYAAAVDPASGALGWSHLLNGQDGQEAPKAIAVDSQGASALDRLGLPHGTLSYVPSQEVTTSTSLRAGDAFYVKSGSGAAVAIAIEAGDTLATLATKIGRASGFTATAATLTSNNVQQLKIAPANSHTTVQLLAGPPGRDALRALGLTAGTLTDDTSAAGSPLSKATQLVGLNLPASLNLSDPTNIKAAQAALSVAIAKVENAYQTLTKPKTSTSGSAGSDTVPAYLTARIADYQLALSRLTGSSSSTSA